MTTVIGLSGSLRRNSLNTRLLEVAIGLAPPDMTIERAGFGDFPVYNQDIQERGIPAPVTALAERILRADGVLIVSPEYNYSIPGGLKNAIDWLSRDQRAPFRQKPVAIMGASPGRLGTARMQYHLRQVFVFLDARVLNRPEVMVGGAAALLDAEGRLTDGPTRDIIGRQLAALAQAIADCKRLTGEE